MQFNRRCSAGYIAVGCVGGLISVAVSSCTGGGESRSCGEPLIKKSANYMTCELVAHEGWRPPRPSNNIIQCENKEYVCFSQGLVGISCLKKESRE